MDIYQKRCNQPVVVLACRFSYANQVKVRVVRISLIVTGHFANNVTGFSTRLRGV